MTNPVHACVPASFENASTTLIAANATAAKVVIDQYIAAAAVIPAPQYSGGCSVIDMTAVSTDSVAKDLLIYHGIIMSTVGGATGAVTTTANTIVRASGSFIADGWLQGSLVMTFVPKGVASNTYDGILGIVSAVTALTLTVHGAPFGNGAIANGSRLCNMSLDLRAQIPAASGSNGTTSSLSLLNHGNDGSLLRAERKLGANEIIAVAVNTAVSALPAYINISAQLARY